jgi:hypothetical protein
MKNACLAYSSTLKMEEMPSSETLADFTELHGVATQKVVLFFGLTHPREDQMTSVRSDDARHLVVTLKNSLRK